MFIFLKVRYQKTYWYQNSGIVLVLEHKRITHSNKISPLILNSGIFPAGSPPEARWQRQEAVDWPEADPGLCALESGGSGSGQCRSSASGLPGGPYQR